MSKDLKQTRKIKETWVYRLPLQLASFLLAIALVTSQFNPCDATSVSIGRSLAFILIAMGIAFFVALDSVLFPVERESGRLYRWLGVSFAVFGAWLWICTVFVPGRGNARFAYNGCWQWIAEGILTLAISKLCLRSRIAAPVCAWMLGCAAGTIAYAGYQYFVSMPALRERFKFDPNSLFAEMEMIVGSTEAMQFASRLTSLEPTGPFALTNSLAGLMAAWLVFLVALLGSQTAASIAYTTATKVKWTSLSLATGLIGGFFVTLLLTKSRSAWLATIISLFAACLFHPVLRQSGWAFAKRFRIPVAMIAIVCIIGISGFLVRDPTIIGEAGKSLTYRFDYWRGAIAIIESEPWIGYGVANFQQNYNRVKVITASESPADPHNFILETAVAGGLPLLAVLIAILIILLLKTLHLSRTTTRDVESPFGSKTHPHDDGRWSIFSGGLCACVGLLLFGFFLSDDDTLYASILFVGVSISVFVMLERLQWLVNRDQIAAVCMISASVILVHLLASGGWMQPGVMNSLCVFVGIAFGSPAIHLERNMPMTKGRPWFYPMIGLLFVMVAIADVARTMCLPVLGAAAVESEVSSNITLGQESSDWLRIIKIDPYDPNLPSMAANQCVEVLRRNDLSNSMRKMVLDVFDACCAEYIRRDPNQWIPFSECGKWNAVLADAEPLQDPGQAVAISRKELAYEYFSKAAAFYPNSAQTRLQAAVAAAWCGKSLDARMQWSKAESIDRETPHADRKLSAVVVFFPNHLESIVAPLEENSRIEQRPGYAKGEPIVRWLRTNVP